LGYFGGWSVGELIIIMIFLVLLYLIPTFFKKEKLDSFDDISSLHTFFDTEVHLNIIGIAKNIQKLCLGLKILVFRRYGQHQSGASDSKSTFCQII
jgi:hypothetical protein